MVINIIYIYKHRLQFSFSFHNEHEWIMAGLPAMYHKIGKTIIGMNCNSEYVSYTRGVIS